jgi:hypothetical protein
MVNFLVVCNLPMTFQRQLPRSGQQNLGGTDDYAGEAVYERQRLTKAKKKMFGKETGDRTLKGVRRCRTMTDDRSPIEIARLSRLGPGAIILAVFRLPTCGR